jgi:ribosomal protein L11 methyltransferase
MKYPALDVRGADPELVLAVVDDFAPSAVEELADGISIFFTSAEKRDGAHEALGSALPAAMATPREVDDEDWARRSQAGLTPVTVGRITVSPPWFAGAGTDSQLPTSHPQTPASDFHITIVPSMGFGTGHHATTRVCLSALQMVQLKGMRVVDVGTGSGVLAIAAAALGADDVLGLDVDPDAVANARENAEANPNVRSPQFETVDLQQADLSPADVVLANLTGAVLVHTASRLKSVLRPGGRLIVSGLQSHERDDVLAAFIPLVPVWIEEESDWVGIMFADPAPPDV